MLTHGDALLKATAQAAFWQSFENFLSLFTGMFAPVTSDSDQETYPWLAYAPGVREMVGERVKRSVPELTWTIKNKKWENTVVIDYETRRFSRLNQVQALLGNLGAKARAYPDKLLSTILNNATSTACYDTQFFFDTDHFDPGAAYTTNQSNNLLVASTTGTVWSDIERADAVAQGKAQLMGFKDGDGDPVMVSPNFRPLVMCPIDMYAKMYATKTSVSLTGGVSNQAYDSFDLVGNPYMTAAGGTDYFTIFNVTGAHKPFIVQTAEPVSLEDDMGGDSDFNSKDVAFGSFAYYNVGYGDWRYGCRVYTS